MSDLATTNAWTTAGTAEAVSLPRRHLLALAILVCVPLPALSLAATVIPLPQMLERVTAAFSTLAPPALGGDGSVIRERKVTLGTLKITHAPSEQPPRSVVADGFQRANGASMRATSTDRGIDATKPATSDRGGSETYQADPGAETDDKPVDTGTTGSDGGTTGPGETPSPPEPTGTPSTPEPRPDPPSPRPPAPETGGAGGGSGGGGNSGGSGGSGGGGNSGGSSSPGSPGSGLKEPPAGGTPPDPGGGGPPPDTGKGTPGSGSGPPTEPTPSGNGPPGPGDRGKP